MAEVAVPIQLQSAVRLPTPEPADLNNTALPAKRKRSFSSRSPSQRRGIPRRDDYSARSPSPQGRAPPRRDYSRSPSPRRAPVLPDVDRRRAAERERQLQERLRVKPDLEEQVALTAEEKQAKAKEEYNKLLSARSGGTYIPPARLRALQAQVTDKSSKEYQRMAWEALKKSINGLINKCNKSNIKALVGELFSENLVRGRGLFCRSIMKAQAASLPFTSIFASLVAIVNTKLPQVGELLISRLVVQFRKAFRRSDKAVCKASTVFISQLVNQQVVHEILAAQILQLLLSKPTDDSVEIAVELTREVGQHLEEMNPAIALLVFDQFRSILHEADIDKRTQYMIEVLFQVRKDKYKENPAVPEELDLIEEEDQITHRPPGLDEDIDVEDGLNIFKYDSDYEQNEEAYNKLKAEILGEADGSDEGDDDASEDSSDDEEAQKEKNLEIQDQTATDLTALRRTIYLTLQSSAGFEEAVHKLVAFSRNKLPVGSEHELPSMIIESCSQMASYTKFYGLVGERLARLNRLWTDLFEQQFTKYYDTIHRYEIAKLRNIAHFFGYMLGSDAIGWHVFSVIELNEEATTSASRIYIKLIFQDLVEEMGLKRLVERLKDETLRPSLSGLFSTDNARNMRFSINYFTAIGLGAITEDTREALKNLPKPVIPALPAVPAKVESDAESVSSYSSYSSYTGSSRTRSRSYSRSRSPPKKSSRGAPRGRSYSPSPKRSRTPPRKVAREAARGRSYSRSVSRSVSRSRSPPRKSKNGACRGRSYSHSYSRSRSPVRKPASGAPRRRSYSPSVSRPRSPPKKDSREAPRRAPRRRSYTRSPSRTPPHDVRSARPPVPARRPSFSPSPPRRGRSPPLKAARAPARRRRNSSSISRSPSESRSRSPPRRTTGGAVRGRSDSR